MALPAWVGPAPDQPVGQEVFYRSERSDAGYDTILYTTPDTAADDNVLVVLRGLRVNTNIFTSGAPFTRDSVTDVSGSSITLTEISAVHDGASGPGRDVMRGDNWKVEYFHVDATPGTVDTADVIEMFGNDLRGDHRDQIIIDLANLWWLSDGTDTYLLSSENARAGDNVLVVVRGLCQRQDDSQPHQQTGRRRRFRRRGRLCSHAYTWCGHHVRNAGPAGCLHHRCHAG